ncbi:uncharacterized protein PG986_004566 [Apiospora aurea]|uniref:Uncharacterized protein n=1 Tax=Apiospora aurea TaxID=335848 RepID=A0ABR1QNF6_9PEZI
MGLFSPLAHASAGGQSSLTAPSPFPQRRNGFTHRGAPFHLHRTHPASHHHLPAPAVFVVVSVVVHEPGRRNGHGHAAGLWRRLQEEEQDEGEAVRLPRPHEHLPPRRADAGAVSVAYGHGGLHAHRGGAPDVRVPLVHAAACYYGDGDSDGNGNRHCCRDRDTGIDLSGDSAYRYR